MYMYIPTEPPSIPMIMLLGGLVRGGACQKLLQPSKPLAVFNYWCQSSQVVDAVCVSKGLLLQNLEKLKEAQFRVWGLGFGGRA